MPIGAVVGTPAVWEKVFAENPYLHTSTFGGNQAACTAALVTLDIIEREQLCERSRIQGAKLHAALDTVRERHPDLLREVRGRGLMLGVEFTDPDIGKLAIGSMVHGGVVAAYTLNNPNVMRFEPPLVITDEQIETVGKVFGDAIEEVKALLSEFGV